MIIRHIPRTARPSSPEVSQQGLGAKVDMYVPLSNGIRNDVARGLRTTEDSQTLVTGARGTVTNSTASTFTNYGDVHDVGNKSFFFSIWVKTTQNANGGIVAKSFYGVASNRVYLALVNSGNLLEFAVVDDLGNTYKANAIWSTVTNGQWHQVTCVINRGVDLKLYVDAGLLTTTAFTASYNIQSDYALLLGGYNDASDGTTAHTGQWQFTGELSDFILGHHALTNTEVKELYDNFYQILTPITQYIPTFIPAVGGATGKSNPMYGPLGGCLAGPIG